jgi:O-antigen ligase
MRMLGGAAFALLATALCVRALLDEDRTVAVTQLVTPPEVRLSASLMVRHLVHLLAAAGIGLGALWVGLSRRTWRVGALEVGAMVLAGAALLAVPAASDKRVAINVAIDTILPLLAAATMYHLLLHRPAWRRAVLAGVVAVAAANCWKATAQQGWEYERGWSAYQQNKVQFWSLRGVSPNDPAVAAFEESRKASRPRGFIQGTNLLSSFLLLGLASTGAAAMIRGWRQTRGRAVAAAGLVLLAAWLLVMLLRIHTAGAIVGLVVAVVVVAVGWRLRERPGRLAILLAGGLVLLQTVLVSLAMAPSDLHRSFLNYRGLGEKVRTLGARLCYWDSSLQLFAASPLTGVGPSQFRKHYPVIRPAHSDENAIDVHNWLLNMAAEWGVLGVLGVVIAVAGCGWTILRVMARPPDQADERPRAPLLPALLVVLGCWLLVAFDLPANQWTEVLLYPVAISLVAAVLVSLGGHSGRIGQVILLAGLVGLVVHSAAETTASAVGVMWPFWALVALAMAWNGPIPSAVQAPVRRRWAQAGLVVAGTAVVAVVALTVRPVRAVHRMHQAQRAAVENQPRQAVELFRSAAATDSLDPLPLKAAAFLRYRLAQSDPRRALEHFRDYAELSRAAVERNPLDYGYWRTLSLANMFLATATGDFARIDEAIRNMQRALELNPQWPIGWFELARMAAVEGNQPDRLALLKTALAAADKALEIEDGRAGEVPPTLSPQDRAELLAMRNQVSRRLQIAEARSAATQMAP